MPYLPPSGGRGEASNLLKPAGGSLSNLSNSCLGDAVYPLSGGGGRHWGGVPGGMEQDGGTYGAGGEFLPRVRGVDTTNSL